MVSLCDADGWHVGSKCFAEVVLQSVPFALALWSCGQRLRHLQKGVQDGSLLCTTVADSPDARRRFQLKCGVAIFLMLTPLEKEDPFHVLQKLCGAWLR